MASVLRERDQNQPDVLEPPAKRARSVGSASRAPKQPDLHTKLLGLSVGQLADVLVELVQSGAITGGEETIRGMLPGPDVAAAIGRLSEKDKLVKKALPRYASGNEYSYNRCKTAWSALRVQFAEEIKAMQNAAHWTSCLEFCKLAFRLLEDVLRWERKSHNSWVHSTRKNLAKLAVKAAKGVIADDTVGVEELQQFRESYAGMLNYYDEDKGNEVKDNSIEAAFDGAIAKAKVIVRA